MHTERWLNIFEEATKGYNVGFNITSSYVICSLCDKLQHIRCIRTEYEENNFHCKKCKKVPAPVSVPAPGSLPAPARDPVSTSVSATASV